VGPVIAARGTCAPRQPPRRLRPARAAGLTKARSNRGTISATLFICRDGGKLLLCGNGQRCWREAFKVGAKIVGHGRYVTFQMAEVAESRPDIPGNPVADRPGGCTAHASMRRAGGQRGQGTTAEVRLDQAQATSFSAARPAILGFRSPGPPSRAELVAALAPK
jgi:hypothetical protein